jgi:hypothetical protein
VVTAVRCRAFLSPARKPVRVSLRSSLFFNPRSTHVPNNNGNQRR